MKETPYGWDPILIPHPTLRSGRASTASNTPAFKPYNTRTALHGRSIPRAVHTNTPTVLPVSALPFPDEIMLMIGKYLYTREHVVMCRSSQHLYRIFFGPWWKKLDFGHLDPTNVRLSNPEVAHNYDHLVVQCLETMFGRPLFAYMVEELSVPYSDKGELSPKVALNIQVKQRFHCKDLGTIFSNALWARRHLTVNLLLAMLSSNLQRLHYSTCGFPEQENAFAKRILIYNADAAAFQGFTRVKDLFYSSREKASYPLEALSQLPALTSLTRIGKSHQGFQISKDSLRGKVCSAKKCKMVGYMSKDETDSIVMLCSRLESLEFMPWNWGNWNYNGTHRLSPSLPSNTSANPLRLLNIHVNERLRWTDQLACYLPYLKRFKVLEHFSVYQRTMFDLGVWDFDGYFECADLTEKRGSTNMVWSEESKLKNRLPNSLRELHVPADELNKQIIIEQLRDLVLCNRFENLHSIYLDLQDAVLLDLTDFDDIQTELDALTSICEDNAVSFGWRKPLVILAVDHDDMEAIVEGYNAARAQLQ